MSSYKCYTCGATVVGDSFGHRYRCATCEQTEILGKQADASRRAAADQAAQQAEDNRRFQDQQLELTAAAIKMTALNAALDRATRTKDTLDAARYAVEAHYSADDAYQYGLNYMTTEWLSTDPHGLSVWFDEAGDYHWSCEDPPYLTPHMMSAFNRGVKQTVSAWTRPDSQYLESCVSGAGQQLMRDFHIPWTVPETGQQVRSVDFHSALEVHVISTGYIEYRVNDPFDSPGLNTAFCNGVLEKQTAVNTPESIQNMLQLIEQDKKQQQQDKILGVVFDYWWIGAALVVFVWIIA
jgi:DNA-directed RNA polymerase subunit RPC12/RpoP